MAYSIITTPGFIIHSEPRGEAGKLLYIFTRDLGLIMAGAQGIRFEKSKLRYGAQDYQIGEFSFVRGREFWRLTDARSDPPSLLAAQYGLIIRVASLLRRLLHGEEPHPELFEIIYQCDIFLRKHADLNIDLLISLESLVVARILHVLGYIGDDKLLKSNLNSAEITLEVLANAKDQNKLLIRHINMAINESQL